MVVLLGNTCFNGNASDKDSVSEKSNGHVGWRTLERNSFENVIRNCSENNTHRTSFDSNRVTFENTDALLRDQKNYRIMQEMDGLLRLVNTQIQRAVSEAISTQVLPQIQNTIRNSQGVNVEFSRVEKPEWRSEAQENSHKMKSTLLQLGISRDNLGKCHYTNDSESFAKIVIC